MNGGSSNYIPIFNVYRWKIKKHITHTVTPFRIHSENLSAGPGRKNTV